jgi:hypothetical protein
MDAATAGLIGAAVGAFLGLAGTIADRILGGRRANLDWLRQLQLPNYRSIVQASDAFANSIRSLTPRITTLLLVVAHWLEESPATFPYRPSLEYSQFMKEIEERLHQLERDAANFSSETSAFSLVTSEEARSRLSAILRVQSIWIDSAESMLSHAPGSEPELPPGWTENTWTESSPQEAARAFREAADGWQKGAEQIEGWLSRSRGQLFSALRADLGLEAVRWWQRRRRLQNAQRDEESLIRDLGGNDSSAASLPDKSAEQGTAL